VKRMTITLPDGLADEFLHEVQRQRRPVSWVARDAIRFFLLKNCEVAGTPESSAPATPGVSTASGGSRDTARD